MINNAPVNPAQTPNNRRIPIRSPRIGIDKTVTKIGVRKKMECAVARSIASIPEKKKNAVAIINTERIICNLKLYVLDNLKNVGLEVSINSETSITVSHQGNIKAQNIITDVYPGFPTDMQPQWIALMTLSNGESTTEDTIYHDRFSNTRNNFNNSITQNIYLFTNFIYDNTFYFI